ncbi:MAG: BlaI/MecI/CopY family transcriptional regulator [Defluviitaleaceae bacterium]|nr:BlaI/MecI/CopY family transcriptional regulator [Defluviitaleaceae bacterium]
MNTKLFDSELKVMEVIWKEGALPAKAIADALAKSIGWNKNTTYTVIKKCIEKGAIERSEPNFICRAIVNKDDVQSTEVDELVDKLFDGSTELLFASLVGRNKLPPDMIEKLKHIVGEQPQTQQPYTTGGKNK